MHCLARATSSSSKIQQKLHIPLHCNRKSHQYSKGPLLTSSMITHLHVKHEPCSLRVVLITNRQFYLIAIGASCEEGLFDNTSGKFNLLSTLVIVFFFLKKTTLRQTLFIEAES